MSSIKKTIYWLCIASTAVPLVYVVQSLYPISYPKAAVLQTLVAAATVLTVWVWLREKHTRPQKSFLLVSLAIFMLVQVAAALLGVDPVQSWWSDMVRASGVFFQLHIFFLALLLGSGVLETRHIRRVLTASVGVAIIVAVVGIAQYFKPDLLPNVSTNRIGSFFGNPVFLAGYLVLHIFLSPLMWSWYPKKWSRVVIAIAALFWVVALLLTQGRGSYLGFLVGAFVFLFLFAREKRPNMMRWVYGATAAAVVLFGLLWSYRSAPFIQQSTFLQAITSSATIFTRSVNWSIAWNGFIDRPLLGWGPETYRYVLDTFFDSRLTNFSFLETFVDKPHNAYFELLAGSGILGFVAYICVVIGLFLLLRRLRRDARLSTHEYAGIVALLAAHGVQNFFLFETIPTYLVLSFVVGYVLHLSRTEKEAHSHASLRFGWRMGALAAVAVIMVFVWYRFTLLPFISSVVTNTGLQYTYVDNWLEARKRLLRALTIDTPYAFERWRWSSAAAAEVAYAKTPNQTESELPSLVRSVWRTDIETFAQEGERLLAQGPRSHLLVSFLGKYYYQIGLVTKEDRYIRRAEALFKEATALSPNREEGHLLLAQAAIFRKDYEAAEQITAAVLARNPGSSLVRWYHAFALLQMEGRLDEGLAEAARAIEQGFAFENEAQLDVLAQYYVQKKDYEGLVRLYEIGKQFFPKSADLYSHLAAAYAAVGRYADARAAVIRSVELDPSFARDAEEFLKQLPK